MTDETLVTSAIEPSTGPLPKRRPYAVEKPRFPLVFKLFGLTALLILIVVGLAIGVTIDRANRIAHLAVNSSISSAVKLFKDFERQRLGQLTLGAQLIGNDPSFAAYIQSALSGGDVRSISSQAGAAPVPVAPGTPAPPIDFTSIVDQLQDRKALLGSDVLMLLDEQGRLVARTDQPVVTNAPAEDLYESTSLVKRIVDDANVESTAGVLVSGDKLYHAAIAPIAVGVNHVRSGYIINAYAIDDDFANRIAQSTNAGVIFASGKGSIRRSTNAPSVGMQQMRGVETIFRSGKGMPPTTERIDDSDFIVTGEPLMAGKQSVGAAVFIRSLDRELTPFREIEKALFAGGGGALLLAFIFSWLIAKRVTRPIEELAGLAQAVTHGDYSVHPAIDRGDEVGILGRSFAQMITALQDKAELEDLYDQMAARSKEREAIAVGPRLLEPAKLDEGTVLVTDLRGLPATVGEGDATNVIAAIARVMRLQEREVERQDGEVREVVGHRLVSVFRGERGIIHAIRAARAINEELATQSGTPPMSIGVGVATGEFVTGSVELEHETGLAIIGNAPLLALLFAWHAPSGHAYISYESAQAAGGEVLSTSQREEVRLKWLTQPLPVASLPLLSINTGMIRSVGGTVATMRMDPTVPDFPMQVSADLAAGLIFAGRYRVEQVLGRGGMGVVYRANDTQLDEVVAIKTLPGDVMMRSPEDLERFKREIRLARKITHRNVLRTYDYGEADGVYFISMEYVRGYTLSELLGESDNRQMAPRLAMGIARQICRGLQAAHEQGIIHRDIKPQNVLIDHKGEVKLMDFGIARMAEAPESMTQAGLIVGTPHYMSPEQVQGKQLDPRSDVYAMGVLLYEMLTGQRPFESSSLTGVLTAHITETPRPPIEIKSDIGREVNAIVLRCLAKDPKARYADAGELLYALDQVQLPASAAA